MASYYDREDDTFRQGYRNFDEDERNRGQRYRGALERERGWDLGREDAGRFGTGSRDNYEREYGSRYYTGDEQGRGFAGGRAFGRSYTPSTYDRGFGDGQRAYGRSYSPSAEHESERHYEGTYRPPDYGRNFKQTHHGDGFASDRDWFDRASDEVASWFGDQGAERRRHRDKSSGDKSSERDFRGRGPKGYRRSDERIREDVNDRLTDYPHLDASDVEVSVKDGDVTLSGTVHDRADKRITEAIVESVSGVKNVDNNLRVEDKWRNTATTQTTPRAV